MSGRPGRPGTPGSGPSRQTGGNRPSGPRRPGRSGSGGNNDNVMPLITGVLGSSILAFSLYVFSQNPGFLGEIVHSADDEPSGCYECWNQDAAAYEPAVQNCEPAVQNCEPAFQAYESCYEASGPAVARETSNRSPKISIEKKRWLSEEEEEIIKNRRLIEKQSRGKLQKELSEHLKKVKEIRDELHKEKRT